MKGGRKDGPTAKHAPADDKTKAGGSGVLLGLLAAGLVILAGLGGMLFWQAGAARPQAEAQLGGPFHMVDQDGRPVDQSILNGRWSAVFFGYTYCPDVCPATLQALGQASKRLGDKARTLQIVFVSIDPARDTPKMMKDYIEAQAIPVRTIGLTGSPAQVAAIAKAYRVYYAKVGTGRDYSMDHTALVYLMDPTGHFAAPLSHDMAPDRIAQEIAKAET